MHCREAGRLRQRDTNRRPHPRHIEPQQATGRDGGAETAGDAGPRPGH